MRLNKNDTIGIIALSGDCDKLSVEKSKLVLESLGYKVKLSENIFYKSDYLAGNDRDKLSSLYSFFLDEEIKLILPARGGYGAIRILEQIDYDMIKSHPKLFCGFSDVTAYLLMFYKKTGLITYHGPMACTDFNKDLNSFTLENFYKAINDKNLKYQGNKLYNYGEASGITWGGNLSTIVSMIGLDFLPNEDFIFFTEDLNEPVYKIDKMFQQLINLNDFRRYCKAIVLGDFLNVDNEKWLDNYFNDLSKRLNIPIVSGFKITHSLEKITLPIGKQAKLSGLQLEVS